MFAAAALLAIPFASRGSSDSMMVNSWSSSSTRMATKRWASASIAAKSRPAPVEAESLLRTSRSLVASRAASSSRLFNVARSGSRSASRICCVLSCAEATSASSSSAFRAGSVARLLSRAAISTSRSATVIRASNGCVIRSNSPLGPWSLR